MKFIYAIFKIEQGRALVIQAKMFARVVHFCRRVDNDNLISTLAATEYMLAHMSEITSEPKEIAFLWCYLGTTLHGFDSMWTHVISLKQETVDLTTLEILADMKMETDNILSPLN